MNHYFRKIKSLVIAVLFLSGCARGEFKTIELLDGASGGTAGIADPTGGQGGTGNEEAGSGGITEPPIIGIEDCIKETFQVDETKFLNEICDGIDNDCDGRIDEGITGEFPIIEGRPATSVSPDCDQDNYPISQIVVTRCFLPGEPNNDDIPLDSIPITEFCEDGQWASSNLPNDCNDEDPDINPFDRNTDICGDNVDNDCDGRIDNEPDLSITEICDEIDNDCDGKINESPEESRIGTSETNAEYLWIDCDGDNYGRPLLGDAKARRCTISGREFITYDGISLPCPNTQWVLPTPNGVPNDCDDFDPHIHHLAEERCNGIDDDCDGIFEEDLNPQLYTTTRVYPDCDNDRFARLDAPSQIACRDIEGGPLIVPLASPVDLGYCPSFTRDSANWTTNSPRDSNQNPTFDCNDLRFDDESFANQWYYADCDGDGHIPSELFTYRERRTAGDNCGQNTILMDLGTRDRICGSNYIGAGAPKWLAQRSPEIDCWDYDNRAYRGAVNFQSSPISSYRAPGDLNFTPPDQLVSPFDFNCNNLLESEIPRERNNLRNPLSNIGPEHWCPTDGEPVPIPDEIAASDFLSRPLDVCTINAFGTCIENRGWCNDSRQCGGEEGPVWTCDENCTPIIDWNYQLRCK